VTAGWQSLLSVDDIITDLYALLDELDVATKTFVMYSSDHGYKQGQWRVGTSKQHPYETDIHVPLLFTGPGIPAGTILQHMSGNVDIMPTVLDLAGGPGAVPPFVDGKSLVSLLIPEVAAKRAAGALERGVAETQPWRDAFLVEYVPQPTPLQPVRPARAHAHAHAHEVGKFLCVRPCATVVGGGKAHRSCHANLPVPAHVFLSGTSATGSLCRVT